MFQKSYNLLAFILHFFAVKSQKIIFLNLKDNLFFCYIHFVILFISLAYLRNLAIIFSYCSAKSYISTCFFVCFFFQLRYFVV
jgi:hypothetical protein